MRWPAWLHLPGGSSGGDPGDAAQGGGGADAPAGSRPGAPGTSAPARPAGAWRSLAPVQRAIAGPPLTAPAEPFIARLATQNPPEPMLGPLGHDVRADGPAGLVTNLARPIATPVSRQAAGPAAPLPAPRPVDGHGRAHATGGRAVSEAWLSASGDDPDAAASGAWPAAPADEAPGGPEPVRHLPVATGAGPAPIAATRVADASAPPLVHPNAPAASAAPVQRSADGAAPAPATAGTPGDATRGGAPRGDVRSPAGPAMPADPSPPSAAGSPTGGADAGAPGVPVQRDLASAGPTAASDPGAPARRTLGESRRLGLGVPLASKPSPTTQPAAASIRGSLPLARLERGAPVPGPAGGIAPEPIAPIRPATAGALTLPLLRSVQRSPAPAGPGAAPTMLAPAARAGDVGAAEAGDDAAASASGAAGGGPEPTAASGAAGDVADAAAGGQASRPLVGDASRALGDTAPGDGVDAPGHGVDEATAGLPLAIQRTPGSSSAAGVPEIPGASAPGDGAPAGPFFGGAGGPAGTAGAADAASDAGFATGGSGQRGALAAPLVVSRAALVSPGATSPTLRLPAAGGPGPVLARRAVGAPLAPGATAGRAASAASPGDGPADRGTVQRTTTTRTGGGGQPTPTPFTRAPFGAGEPPVAAAPIVARLPADASLPLAHGRPDGADASGRAAAGASSPGAASAAAAPSGGASPLDGGGGPPAMLSWTPSTGFTRGAPALDVQRAVRIDELEVSPQGAEPRGAGGTASPSQTGGTAGAGGATGDIDDLAEQIFDRVRDRIANELLLDRERAGLLIDA